MTATGQNIGTDPKRPFVEGDHRTIEIRVTTGVPPAPKDLTGATASWAMYPWPNGDRNTAPPGPVAAVTKASGGGGIAFADAPGGILRVELLPADSTGRAGDWWHEAQVVDAQGRVATTTTGWLRITPQRLV